MRAHSQPLQTFQRTSDHVTHSVLSTDFFQKEQNQIPAARGVHQSALDTLHRAGYDNVEYLKTSLAEDELKERIANAHFVESDPARS